LCPATALNNAFLVYPLFYNINFNFILPSQCRRSSCWWCNG
jgi:hypothetical protein